MDKVKELIRLLHEGNEEVKNLFNVLMVDPELSVDLDGDKVYFKTPKDFDVNFTKKIDDILERNK